MAKYLSAIASSRQPRRCKCSAPSRARAPPVPAPHAWPTVCSLLCTTKDCGPSRTKGTRSLPPQTKERVSDGRRPQDLHDQRLASAPLPDLFPRKTVCARHRGSGVSPLFQTASPISLSEYGPCHVAGERERGIL